MSASTSRSLGLSERLDRLKVVVTYLKSLAAEPAVRRPMYRMGIARTLVYLGPAGSLGLMATGRYFPGFALLTLVFLALPVLLFYDVGQRGRLAHLVAAYARSDREALSAEAADRSLSGKRGRLFLLGVAEWLERRLQSQAEGEESGLIATLVGAVVGEVLDVGGAFLLPALVLEDLDLDGAAKRLRQLMDHAPAALTGSVGIDAVSGLLSGLFWGPVVLLAIALLAAGLLEVVAVSTLLGIGAACALLLAFPMAGIQTLQETVKAVYFTALFLLVAHPDELSGDRADSLEGLVRFTDPDRSGPSSSGEGETPGSGGEAPGTEGEAPGSGGEAPDRA